ncbi:MAG: UPF0280 family protein [Bacillota bacterium]|nr:UPF0280 family protein [Bacillota bacterium]MDW7682970.1 UPF0280 family protein [Bacillota bacterium]
MDTSRRSYRQNMQPAGFAGFACKIKETDLQIFVDQKSYTPELAVFCEQRVLYYRTLLEDYLRGDAEFGTTLQPYLAAPDAPPLVLAMIRAGNLAGVGPMAAVAGTFAECVGRDLLQHVQQVIVENGGDIFLRTEKAVCIAVFAGSSPFSNQIALELPAAPAGLGVCTSSGTVGPSLSFGKADAAVIVARSAPLADAVATATANHVQSAEDLDTALAYAKSIPGVDGALLIKDDKLAAWGKIKLTRL